jgi:alkylhydroperoxidase/carboxymuconolactone decarboxylase family protein YurZ
MPSLSTPPDAFVEFITRFPDLGRAWETTRQAERTGPLDEKACRLVKLAVAIGGRSEGAVHSAARKAIAVGVSVAEIEQVIALVASTVGFPRAVTAYSWIREVVSSPVPITESGS